MQGSSFLGPFFLFSRTLYPEILQRYIRHVAQSDHPDSRFSEIASGKDVSVLAPLLFNIYFSAMLPARVRQALQQYASMGAGVMKNIYGVPPVPRTNEGQTGENGEMRLGTDRQSRRVGGTVDTTVRTGSDVD